MRRRAATVAVAAALLAGCSSTSAPGPERAVRSPRPSAVVTPTADPATARLQALAQLAEQAAAALPTAPATTPPAIDGPALGADVGWPQCPKGMGIPQRRTLGLPMPSSQATYVVVGLTNGPGFTPNPCLADQVAWVKRRHLLAAAYAVVSLPDARQLATYGDRGPFDAGSRLGTLANAGYQQALSAVATMRRAGLATPMVWVDVEPVPDFDWSTDTAVNGAVVQGAARGFADAGYRVGVYSTPHLWQLVVGELALRLPEWRAAGQTSRAEALARCADDGTIQGGEAVLAQWVENRRDLDVTCPGVGADLGRWFQQY